jgi:predicted ATPase/DNA-binding SARP family transcriptional activator
LSEQPGFQAIGDALMTKPPLTLSLFGPMRVLVNGEPMPRVRTRAAEWLLALLVLRRQRAVSRLWLADTLWPDSQETQGLQNLRHSLLSLRRSLGAEERRIQSPTRDTLTLDLEGAHVDVVQFDRAIRREDEEALRSAVELYTGPLLEGCLEEWVFPERESRRQACLSALLTLANTAEKRQDYENALTLLRRSERMDSLRISTQRGLMRVLWASGDAPAALTAYRDFRHRLRNEMNLEPDVETARLYQQIRDSARTGERGSEDEDQAQREPTHDEHSLTAREAQRREVRGWRNDEESGRAGEAIHDPAPLTQTPGPRPSAFSLPHSLTALIGRERETAEIAQAVTTSRLVTLVGGGGVGKTRLAIHAARDVASQYDHGACFIALASLSDPALVAAFVASALGMREESTPQPELLLNALMSWLSTRSLLLILDNCEHLIEAAAELAQTLLERCPRLHILATSRQSLGLTGEIVWRVPSLLAPDPEQVSREEHAVEAVLQYPAAQLFVERAAMARPGFQVTEQESAVAIARICRRLDGIPLAIELAAARIGLLNVEQIAAKLDDRFRLLTGGRRGVMARHQTLRSLIDWSYDLLTPEERALLRRLSVFPAGWTLDAAEALGGGLDPLASLMDKSLVLAQEQEGGSRYRMLETVREYAREKLRESGEEAAALQLHNIYYQDLVEESAKRLLSSSPEPALSLLEAEVDNLRAALSWAQAQSPQGYLRFVALLWPFWEIRGHLTEGRTHLRAALRRVDVSDTATRPQALLGATVLAVCQFDMEEALGYGEECLQRFREQEDTRGIAASLLSLAEAYLIKREFDRSAALVQEALEYSRRSGWPKGMASSLLLMGSAAQLHREWRAAQSLYEQGLELAEALGDRRMIASACYQLGAVALNLNDYARARICLTRSLDIYKRLGDRRGTSRTLGNLGLLERKGDQEQAMAYTLEYIKTSRELGNPADEAHGLHEVGNIHYQRGDFEQARQAYRAALDVFMGIGTGFGLGFALNSLGNALFHLGEPQQAQRLHRQALSVYLDRRNEEGIVWTLERFTVVEAKYGDIEEAARLLGAASIGRERLGIPLAPWDQADWDEAISIVRKAMGEAAFANLWAEGRTLTQEQAVACIVKPSKPMA